MREEDGGKKACTARWGGVLAGQAQEMILAREGHGPLAREFIIMYIAVARGGPRAHPHAANEQCVPTEGGLNTHCSPY